MPNSAKSGLRERGNTKKSKSRRNAGYQPRNCAELPSAKPRSRQCASAQSLKSTPRHSSAKATTSTKASTGQKPVPVLWMFGTCYLEIWPRAFRHLARASWTAPMIKQEFGRALRSAEMELDLETAPGTEGWLAGQAGLVFWQARQFGWLESIKVGRR